MTDKNSRIKFKLEEKRTSNLMGYCNHLARIPEYGAVEASDEYFRRKSIIKEREAILRGE